MERAMDSTPGSCFKSLGNPFWANSPLMEYPGPPVPVPSSCAGAWLRFLCGRQTDSSPRAMFGAYKAVTAAQLYFGEPTLNKYRMLELYQRYVPDFPDKPFGEQVIRNYIGSFYPERPPLLLPAARYAAFITELERLVENS